jgi:exocyst complex component 4
LTVAGVFQSTVTVERCVREWRAVLQALPLYSERIAVYSCKALKEYKDTCFAAYQGIVQPHSEDRRICSAAWLKDEDISRFLKYAACSSWSGRVSF